MKNINNKILQRCPAAEAIVRGGEKYPNLCGKVRFFNTCDGTIVETEFFGLPRDGFFALHIHEGNDCGGTAEEPFAVAGKHLNLTSSEHPFHTGDLPPVLGCNGYSWSAVFTGRFRPSQVRGRVVIIHENPDDFHTQPSGNAGAKIGCGIIK